MLNVVKAQLARKDEVKRRLNNIIDKARAQYDADKNKKN